MTTQQDSWDACPSGELSHMVDARKAQRRRRVMDRAAVVAASAMVCIAIGGFALGVFSPDPSAPAGGANYGGIACADVVDCLPAYLADQRQDPANTHLDAATVASITEHLSHCPACRQHYEQTKLQQGISLLYDAGSLLAAAAGR